MTLNDVKNKFKKNPKYLETGAGKLSKAWNTTVDIIHEAKKLIRSEKESEVISSNYIETLETLITGADHDIENNTKKVTIASPKPLTPKEIEVMVGVDQITSYVARVWDKLLPTGNWTYSVDIRYRVNDFYTEKEMSEKLQTIFPKNLSVVSMTPRKTDKQALFIYISDDHCGSDFKNSLYGKVYNETVYRTRLLKIVEEAVNLNKTFEKVYIVNMGDEIDGWNGKTTRYDHDLGSLSNKEQFDMYINGRKEFYDALFTSNISNSYTIRNLNNSNHSGLGLSYIVNATIGMYVNARYKHNVTIENQEKFIDSIEYGNHIFGFTHGKDEQYMKAPFPLNLDAKTDLWLYDFYSKNNDNITDKWVSTMKGDIHKYNVNVGKSGRYVNVASISSGSNWIEHNFGDSAPGALLEVVDPYSKNIHSIPIWL